MSAVGLASTETKAAFVAAAKSNVKSVILKPLGKRREAVKGKTSGGEIQCFKTAGLEGNSVCKVKMCFMATKKNKKQEVASKGLKNPIENNANFLLQIQKGLNVCFF